MRTLISVALLCFAAVTSAFAADAPPSDASIRRLLVATDAKKMLDNTLATLDVSMNNGIQAALANRPLNEQGHQIVDDMRKQLTAVMQEALNWNDLEPLIVDAYQHTLSQSEVNGMIKFYESDAGKAVVRKMPAVLQYTTQLMQERMKTVMPKIVKIEQDAIMKAKAVGTPEASPAH